MGGERKKFVEWKLINVSAAAMNILITGHPKSGTTWLCRILDCLLQASYRVYKNIDGNIKRIYTSKNDVVIFSYLNNPLKTTCFKMPKHDKCIVLYREFKDLLVSCYFQQKFRAENRYSGEISEFVDYAYGGIDNIVRFYNFVEQHGRDKEYLYYEKMEETLQALSVFDKTKLTECIALNSFENMRKQEVENYANYGAAKSNAFTASLPPQELCPTDINNINSYKTRNGEVGAYINYLSQKDIEKIDAATVQLIKTKRGRNDSII